jgi:type I restriction enzyme S subunit
MPIIRIQNLTNPNKPLNKTTRAVDSAYVVNPGDILVSWSATLDAFIWDREPALLNQHIFKVVPDMSVVTKKFLFYTLKKAIAEMIKSEHLHGSTMKHINRGPFLAHKIEVPTLKEQEEIVAELEKQFSRLDEAVTSLQRVKANLKRYTASVLKAAVEGRLVETAGGWRTSTLGAEGAIIGGLTKNQKRNDLPLKLPYLRVANVYANELRLDDIEYIGVAEKELEKLLVRKGDLLVVEGNGSPDQIGRVALWSDAIPNCVHQNHLIKVRFGGEVLPEWALIWMLSPIGRHEIEKVSASTSGLHTLSVGKVSRLPIGVPLLDEQSRVVAEVDRQLSILRGVEAEVDANLQRAQALRQSVLAKGFQ